MLRSVLRFSESKSRARLSQARLFYLISEELPLTIVPAMGHSENNNADDRSAATAIAAIAIIRPFMLSLV